MPRRRKEGEKRRAAPHEASGGGGDFTFRPDALFESHPQPMWVYDDESLRILAVNDAAIERYGHSREEFLELTIKDIRPAEDIPLLEERLRTQQPSMRRAGVWRHRSRSGELLWVEILAHAIEFRGRAATLVMSFDITARVLAEDELQAERFRLEQAQQVAKVGSWETDLSNLNVLWSDETYRIFGFEKGDFQPTHRTFLDYVHPEDRELVDAAFRASFADREIHTITHRIVLRDGSIKHVEERWRTVVDAKGSLLKALGTCQDVTVRHEALAAREQRDALLRAASRLSHLGAFHVDLITGERHWSDEVCAIHEIPPGRTPSLEEALAFYPPPFRDRMRALYDACTKQGIPYDAELQLVTAKGARRWVRTIAEPRRDEHGRIIALQGALQDITQQRKTNEDLALSEERFRLLTKATNDAVWDWDFATGGLWWNEGFESMFGYKRDELGTGSSWTELIHPEDRARVIESIDRTKLSSDSNWSAEYRFRRKDGGYAHVLDRGYLIRDAQGTVVRMIGAMTDLTSHKATEARLIHQAKLLDAAHDAMIVKDIDDRITYWNKGAERVFGWRADEVIGQVAAELFRVVPERYQEAREALGRVGQWEGELIKHGRDGKPRVVDVRWTLVHDDKGTPTGIFAINADVTARKSLEAQAFRAQRLESIGTLAGGIAHDLNNMLTPILTSIQMLQMDETDPERLDSLATIEASARRGADMVKQVLAFARGSEGQRLQVDLRLIVRDVAKIVQETFPKDIALKIEADPDLWTVTGDATQIHQVLMNLCVNARDAMPKGGILTIALKNKVLDAVYAGMNPDSQSGSYVTIKVIDTGEGIPPKIRDRLFEPFFTTKETGKGTGLGLSTVHSIVKSHSGFVNVYSEPGKGAMFNVYLPAYTAANSDLETLAAVHGPGTHRGSSQLILVVDDELSIRQIVQRTLERFGYRVLLAANGAEGVALFVEHRAEIAVVLTDMAMPVMDGATLIVALRAIDPRVRIIGSSGLAVNDSLARAMGSGVERFLAKPYTAEALLTVIHEVLTLDRG